MLAAVVPEVNKPWELKELPIPKPGISGTYKNSGKWIVLY
jgi:hypothetical protein